MHSETIEYATDGVICKGNLFFNPVKEKRPGVLVAHAWRGQDEFARQKAKELAELGYIGFAADIYGEGKHVDNNDQALELMAPLFLNRAQLRKRIISAFETLSSLPQVDASRIGAIGFCFGGLTVIELFRSGAPIKGAVSFHGLLGKSLGSSQAILAPNAPHMQGALLVLHGALDPFVTWEDFYAFQQEMLSSNVDCEIDIYSSAAHAFTNPEARDVKGGMQFEPKSAARAWIAMQRFFEEVFHEKT